MQERECPAINDLSPQSMMCVKENFHIVFRSATATLGIGGIRSLDDYFYTELYMPSFPTANTKGLIRYQKSIYKSQGLSDHAIGFCFGGVDDDQLITGDDEHIRFVLLSQSSRNAHPYPSLRKPFLAMLVIWNTSGVCRRVGLCMVEEKHWLSLDLEKRLVIMG